jgi:hypothetical protein
MGLSDWIQFMLSRTLTYECLSTSGLGQNVMIEDRLTGTTTKSKVNAMMSDKMSEDCLNMYNRSPARRQPRTPFAWHLQAWTNLRWYLMHTCSPLWGRVSKGEQGRTPLLKARDTSIESF